MKLTKEEKKIVRSALYYYRDDATQVDTVICGFDRSSKEYRELTSAIKKLGL